jgi:hypothetical protein
MSNDNKLVLIKQLVEGARNNLDTVTQLLAGLGVKESFLPGVEGASHAGGSVQRTEQGAVIIEGVFDGQNMVGPDGKLYSVPANYASKSKLVEGDLLKLTISPDGSFIYKQIGPVERDRVVGILSHDDETDEYRILAKTKFYRVLLASVTYFKAEMGDEVVVLVPKGTTSSWAAVENVIKKGGTAGGLGINQDMVSNPITSQAEPTPERRGPGRPRKNPAGAPKEPKSDDYSPQSNKEAAQLTPPPGIEI